MLAVPTGAATEVELPYGAGKLPVPIGPATEEEEPPTGAATEAELPYGAGKLSVPTGDTG